MFSQEKFEKLGVAKTAPTKTARLIMTQFIGLISFMKPVNWFIL